MKISSREYKLIALTIIILILALSYYIMSKFWKNWDNSCEQMGVLKGKIVCVSNLIEQKDIWDKKLQDFKLQLPKYTANQEITAELLKTLEKLARASNLVLLRREPDKERQLLDLSEQSIQCMWEGDLESLVQFLYAVQKQGIVMDIQQISISSTQESGQNGAGKLKGSFTVEYAFVRSII